MTNFEQLFTAETTWAQMPEVHSFVIFMNFYLLSQKLFRQLL